MSEEETMPAETAESVEASAPALGVNDLKLMANIIEVVSNRGALKQAKWLQLVAFIIT